MQTLLKYCKHTGLSLTNTDEQNVLEKFFIEIKWAVCKCSYLYIGEKWYTQKAKTMFYSIQYKNGWLAASKNFHMLTQLSSIINFIITY